MDLLLLLLMMMMKCEETLKTSRLISPAMKLM
jgi:hypothetical protein